MKMPVRFAPLRAAREDRVLHEAVHLALLDVDVGHDGVEAGVERHVHVERTDVPQRAQHVQDERRFHRTLPVPELDIFVRCRSWTFSGAVILPRARRTGSGLGRDLAAVIAAAGDGEAQAGGLGPAARRPRRAAARRRARSRGSRSRSAPTSSVRCRARPASRARRGRRPPQGSCSARPARARSSRRWRAAVRRDLRRSDRGRARPARAAATISTTRHRCAARSARKRRQVAEGLDLRRAVQAAPRVVVDQQHAPRLGKGQARDDRRRPIGLAAPAVEDDAAALEARDADARSQPAIEQPRERARVDRESVQAAARDARRERELRAGTEPDVLRDRGLDHEPQSADRGDSAR